MVLELLIVFNNIICINFFYCYIKYMIIYLKKKKNHNKIQVNGSNFVFSDTKS